MRLTVTLILNLLIIYIKKKKKKTKPPSKLEWEETDPGIFPYTLVPLGLPIFLILCFIDLAFLFVCKFLIWLHLNTPPISHLSTLQNSSELTTVCAALTCHQQTATTLTQ